MGVESGPFAASERWSMAHLISPEDLQAWLEHWAREYEQPHFIPLDPISIPHRYERPEDIECVAFMTAIIAWGRRSSILQSANRMFAPLGDSPCCHPCRCLGIRFSFMELGTPHLDF